MPQAEEYRRNAETCKRLAADAKDQVERDALFRMAAQWNRLAEYKAGKETD